MSKHSFERFNRNLSWNTKFFVLLAAATVIISFLLDGSPAAITIGCLVALVLVLIVEYFQVVAVRHPRAWQVIKLMLLATVVMLSLLSILI